MELKNLVRFSKGCCGFFVVESMCKVTLSDETEKKVLNVYSKKIYHWLFGLKGCFIFYVPLTFQS